MQQKTELNELGEDHCVPPRPMCRDGYEDDEGGPGYMGAASWNDFVRRDTKCADPSAEAIEWDDREV